MNKISLYILLVLIYLGLAKSFIPEERGSFYLSDKRLFSTSFQGAPLSVILIDTMVTGFLIKTYYHRYLVFKNHNENEEKVVRVSQSFYEEYRKFLGMSVFRRFEKDQREEDFPLPPGSLFIGDRSYGRWKFLNSGQRVWVFHNAYKSFPHYFGWGEYRPTYEFFQKMKLHRNDATTFRGLNNEFGRDGTVTSKVFKPKDSSLKIEKEGLVDHIKSFFLLPDGMVVKNTDKELQIKETEKEPKRKLSKSNETVTAKKTNQEQSSSSSEDGFKVEKLGQSEETEINIGTPTNSKKMLEIDTAKRPQLEKFFDTNSEPEAQQQDAQLKREEAVNE